MNIYALLLGIFLCTGMICILAVIICNSLENISKIKNRQSEEELMNILNRAIQREYDYKVNFEFKMKGITIIGNIEKEVNELVKDTINSLGPNVINELRYYYSLESITEMVFRAHLMLLTNYMEEAKVRKSKNKNYEEIKVTK